MKYQVIILLTFACVTSAVHAQRGAQALAPSIPPAEFIGLAERPAGVSLTRQNADPTIRFIDRATSRASSFVTTSRNPFVSSYGGSEGRGSITAEEIWNEVRTALPIAGVNVNKEDPSKSSLVLGDVLLNVGNPLPKHVLNAPIEVVLFALTDEEATFQIIMSDPNTLSSERKVEEFKWRIINDLIPSIQPGSRYKVNLPDPKARR